MKSPITATEFRNDISNLLDQIVKTGTPLEILDGGKRIKITLVEQADKLSNLNSHPNVINCHSFKYSNP